MPEEQKGIDWNSIVTNAVSTLVAAVFVGAAVIVWNSATTINEQIEDATKNVRSNQKELGKSQQKQEAALKTMANEMPPTHTEALKADAKHNPATAA